MSKIKCNQKDCKYNNCEHCTKSGINVDESANCKSYEKGKHPDSSKFEFASLERLQNNIICNADTCLYNKQRKCTVDHLNIGKNKNSAPCVDYEKRN